MVFHQNMSKCSSCKHLCTDNAPCCPARIRIFAVLLRYHHTCCVRANKHWFTSEAFSCSGFVEAHFSYSTSERRA